MGDASRSRTSARRSPCLARCRGSNDDADGRRRMTVTDHAPGPPGLSGIRNLTRFAGKQLVFLRELADAHGDVVEMKMLGGRWFMISHPDDIETLLVGNARIMAR